MNFFKKAVVMLALAFFIGAPALSFAAPTNTFAAAPTKGSDCEKPILGINPWFRGLAVVKDGQCQIAGPGETLDNGKSVDLAGFIWRVALNIIDIGLAAAGYIAFGFVLYGGFQFLTGGNNPSQIEKARKTILNAIVGLVISIAAVTLVNLVFGIIG